ncbi:MAG TPA: RAMP superfamily CRISPR-associated protein [Elainellaceae cyanobacterium]|jgi:CRISPR-associated protein Cmr4
MYHKAYGVVEALAPVHVGATAGEETGNLNLIFRDQFTRTGIIPGSSIRGRFRADMRDGNQGEEQTWYGHESVDGRPDGGTTEALVKFEHASLIWFPVFCPGQPVVWVSCPMLLRRFKRIAGIAADVPKPYTAQAGLQGRQMQDRGKILFFNLGFLEIENEEDLTAWIPTGMDSDLNKLDANKLVVVHDNDIAMLHDMALYRQSRVKLLDDMKKVDTERGAFFNTEALPEGSILVFPVALKQTGWKPFGDNSSSDLYFGGLESIGFGHCRVALAGDYQ